MKIIYTSIMVFALFTSTSIFPQNKNLNSPAYQFVRFNYLDTNNIYFAANNRGASYTYGFQYGAAWKILPQYDDDIMFDQGIWLIGKRNNDTIAAGSQWFRNYSPGPIINGEAAMLIHPEDSLRYRVYKISKNDDASNPDYAEWPIDFGAPINNLGNPLVYGDQTLWTLYNSKDSTLLAPWAINKKIVPLDIEIHQTVFGRGGYFSDNEDIFSNIIFFEWEIINKGISSIDSAYIGFFTDIDFEPMDSNLPAIDTLKNLGFCWSDKDTTYSGKIPPSIGYTLLYGPAIPNLGSTATVKGKSRDNYKNLGITAFRGFADDSYPYPDSFYSPIISLKDVWNFARGLNTIGKPYVNPHTLQQTPFPFSGDPVTGQGWLFNHWTGGGAGFYIFSGPFTLASIDTQWVMMALVPGLGNSNLNSITAMREKVQILRSLSYDSLAFGSTKYWIVSADEKINMAPTSFSLAQNYPNPFNPATRIQYQVSSSSHVTLKVYDVLGNEIAILVNEYKPAGSYEVEFDASSGIRNLASGIYFYQLKSGEFLQTKKMILVR